MAAASSASEQSETVKLIYFALEQKALTPHQAMTCCLVLGEAQKRAEAFDLKAYLLEQGWLEAPQLESLARQMDEKSDEGSSAMTTLDEGQLLSTIHETMVEISASWQGQTQGFEVDATQSLSPEDLPSVDMWSSSDATEALPALMPKQPISFVALPAWDAPVAESSRYKIQEELGRGGLGVVVQAHDAQLGRKVARKSLLQGTEASQVEIESFVKEARITGQLEHPNIMPIYDLGTDEDGELFYTMRLMPPNNLEQALAKGEHSLIQFIKILQQVCMGLEYAHSRGVVHRDIKPANILLGHFGEVLILDWGIAKVLTPEAFHNPGLLQNTPMLNTQKIKGTPAFMAPELVKSGQVSPLIDQYALGIILYQILTGKLPYFTENLYTLLFQICTDPPIPPTERSPDKEIPEELEQICMRMLAKEPQQRFASCREVHDRLEDFLEGTRERKRRHEAAEARISEATQLANEYHVCRSQEKQLREDWEEACKAFEPWESLEKKRPAWERERALKLGQERAISLFGSAIQKYVQALEHEPGNPEARKGLARLYWSKFEEAEQKHDELGQIQYRDLVQFYDDGSYAGLLDGTGELQLFTEPAAAQVEILRFEEHDRRLSPVPFKQAGPSPIKTPLEMGSYLVRIQKQGYKETLYPVTLGRCQKLSVQVKLRTEEEIGPGYISIPGGSFPFGGDPDAPMSLPLEEIFVEDFAISRFPVTFGEYLEFLNYHHRLDPERAGQWVPRSGEEAYACLRDGEYVPDRSTLFHGPVAERYPAQEKHEWNLPVFGVTWEEARLYCRWRSEREGCTICLPTEHQWEKAAAGADRRIFPWGNAFEANFCKMGRSRPPEELQPEPVGTFALDQSPYGMCDVVGSICEWMLPILSEGATEEELKEAIVYRGGGWIASSENFVRIGTRVPKPGGPRSYNCGFRVVKILSKE